MELGLVLESWTDGATTTISPPIKETMSKKQYYYTQEILGLTEHFGKPYFYLKDVDGTIYIAKAKPVTGHSIDGQTGEVSEFLRHYEPDLS